MDSALRKKLGKAIRENNTPTSVACFFGITEKGEIDTAGRNGGCHADLKELDYRIVAISNWHQKMTDRMKDYPHIREFAEFLIQRSNFADAFISKTFEEVLKEGFIVNATLPRDYVSSACVATRVCYEKPAKTTIWKLLVDAGINERLAFLMTGNVSSLVLLEGKYLDLKFGYESNHYAYTLSDGPSKDYVKNVLEGTHKDDSKTFYEKPGYSGFSKIWSSLPGGRCNDGWLRKKMQEAIMKIEIGGRNPELLNPWGDHPPVRTVTNFDAGVFNKILEKEL